ncbi:hypothetical protein AYO44_04645 [Planctomycetaceae bacterium SCGC AG-212-F19]|nr:hypothetical protein AYO44_04645 [Planctomycetaceae bacterium SCGC AG-212-F19]
MDEKIQPKPLNPDPDELLTTERGLLGDASRKRPGAEYTLSEIETGARFGDFTMGLRCIIISGFLSSTMMWDITYILLGEKHDVLVFRRILAAVFVISKPLFLYVIPGLLIIFRHSHQPPMIYRSYLHWLTAFNVVVDLVLTMLSISLWVGV